MCSFILRKEHSLFEDEVLMRKFSPKKDEITRGWRKLHKEQKRNLLSSQNVIRMIKSRRI
jgi:hypothetical protein